MKFIKKLFIGILIIIVAILVFAIFLPSHYKVFRTTVINSTSAEISKKIVDFHEWNKWSPWIGIDSTEKYSYNDTVGIGAKMDWTGEAIGSGNMVITGDSEDSIKYNLVFLSPFESFSTGSLSFTKSELGTIVTWTNEGDLGWPFMRIMNFIKGFDSMMGPDFEKGLAKLKTVVESAPKNSYNIIEKEVSAMTIAVIRNKVSMNEIGDILGKSYGAIQEYIAKQGATMAGQPMAITLAWDTVSWDFEAAIPIDKEIKGNDKIQVKQSYAGKVIYLSYTGPYDGTYIAYTELETYKKEKGYTDNGGPWEVYITDPSMEPDSSKWITEIYFPVK